MLRITPSISLDESEIEERFIRAPGPGGQNVNKVASAVQLRFDVQHSSLPPEIRQRLSALAGRRLSGEGILTVTAHRHRTQAQNRADALARLTELIRRACIAPKPRKKTRPTRASKERRLETKRHRGEIKSGRAKTAAE